MKKVLLFFILFFLYSCGSVNNDKVEESSLNSRDILYKSSLVRNFYINGFVSSSIRDKEGNFCFASTDHDDFRISKLDLDANTIWSNKYENIMYDSFGLITVDKDNNIFLAGIQESDKSSNELEVVAIKFSPDGELLWRNFHTTPEDDIIYDVATDSSGNFYIVGGLITDSTDKAFILKYSALGSFEWIEYINTNYYTNAHSIAIDSEDNIYVTGITGRDIFFAKFLPDGKKVIYKEYNTEADERSTQMCLGKDGYLYIGGYYILNDGEPKLFVKKIDKFGNEKYFTIFDYVEGREYVYAINADEYSNVFLYGEYYSDTRERKIFLTQLDSFGKVSKRYLFDGEAYLGNLMTKTDLSIANNHDIYISGPGFVKLTGDELTQGSYILKLVPQDTNQTLQK